MLQTAILDRFCAELCATLIASKARDIETAKTTNPSLAILAHIENANLFIIPLDAHRRWYRYHHLFAQLLQDRLRRERGAAQIHALHQRASRWFAAQGLRDEAIHHAVQGQDFDEAARLLATIPLDTLWGQQSTTLFKQWGPLIPAQALQRHPRALLSCAAAHLFTGDVDQFNGLLARCEGMDSIYGEYALFKSIQLRSEGDFQQALHLAQEAGESLADDATTLQAIALMQIAVNLLRLGDMPRAERILVPGASRADRRWRGTHEYSAAGDPSPRGCSPAAGRLSSGTALLSRRFGAGGTSRVWPVATGGIHVYGVGAGALRVE